MVAGDRAAGGCRVVVAAVGEGSRGSKLAAVEGSLRRRVEAVVGDRVVAGGNLAGIRMVEADRACCMEGRGRLLQDTQRQCKEAVGVQQQK